MKILRLKLKLLGRKLLYWSKLLPKAEYKKIKAVLLGEIRQQKRICRYRKNKKNFAQAYIDYVFASNKEKSPDFVPLAGDDYEMKADDVKFIAFYLPQFYLFKENDEWHGKGFTEWTNVTKAIPQFVGHYQPHLPIDMGFYSLGDVNTMRRQVELARKYGVSGFCFHYYWFSGRRLMEKPIFNWLENKDIKFPFCLCWANENWSKLWDGNNREVLVEQRLDEGDDERFFDDIVQFFKDERYIKIDGKPLLIIYRPQLFSQERFVQFTKVMRSKAKVAGFPDLFMLCSNVRSFQENPAEWGLDAQVEFPPSLMTDINIQKCDARVNLNFSGWIHDVAKWVKEKKYFYDVDYKLFKTVFPNWDNTARKAYSEAHIFQLKPEEYKQWLGDVADWTKKNHSAEEQYVFINAWNEWAEGAHLEPDSKYGYAYLQATREVLEPETKKIIYVSHNAQAFGAQMLSYHIMKCLREQFGYQVVCLILDGGSLENEYRKIARTINLNGKTDKEIIAIAAELEVDGYHKAICNTVVAGNMPKLLSKAGIESISLVHELPKVIVQYNCCGKVKSLNKYAQKIVFASGYIAEKIEEKIKLNKSKIVIRPQGLYNLNHYKTDIVSARWLLRQELGLPQDAKIVLGVGLGYERKGFDLFIDAAAKICAQNKNVYFVWVGDYKNHLVEKKAKEVEICGRQLILTGFKSDTTLYYAGADIYLLTSREDPFPSVVMEAMNVGLPVIGFENAGGFRDIINDKNGKLVGFEDVEAMSTEVQKLLGDEKLWQNKSEAALLTIKEKFDWNGYVGDLLKLLGEAGR